MRSSTRSSLRCLYFLTNTGCTTALEQQWWTNTKIDSEGKHTKGFLCRPQELEMPPKSWWWNGMKWCAFSGLTGANADNSCCAFCCGRLAEGPTRWQSTFLVFTLYLLYIKGAWNSCFLWSSRGRETNAFFWSSQASIIWCMTSFPPRYFFFFFNNRTVCRSCSSYYSCILMCRADKRFIGVIKPTLIVMRVFLSLY